jgi:hypothetical protein
VGITNNPGGLHALQATAATSALEHQTDIAKCRVHQALKMAAMRLPCNRSALGAFLLASDC